jgi:glutathione peroxidase-family protein
LEEETSMSDIHDIEMSSITGDPVRLSKYQDNLCLIVNVASR